MKDELEADWVADRLTRWRQTRDTEALGELLKWQRDRASAIAHGIIGRGRLEHADADDVVQQAFLKVITRTRGFEDPEAFKLAVYRAVTQCALNLMEANRTRGKRELAMKDQNKTALSAPSSESEMAETRHQLEEELARLPAEDRAAVVMCCQEGVNVSTAAQVLEVPRETVRDRLARSLKILRERLRRRGTMLSLVVLIGRLHEGGTCSASPALCGTLDQILAGDPCANIAPNGPPPPTAATLVIAEAGLKFAPPATPLATGLMTGTAILTILSVGVLSWFLRNRSEDVQATGVPSQTERAGLHKASNPAVTEHSRTGAQATPRSWADTINKTSKTRETEQANLADPGHAAARAGAREITLPLAQIPKAVIQTAQRLVPGIKLTEVERSERNGKVFFELEGRMGDDEYEMRIAEDGTIVRLAREQENEVPEAVARSARKALGDARILKVQIMKEDGHFVYKVAAIGTDGTRTEIKLDADGKMVKGGSTGMNPVPPEERDEF